MKLFKLIAVAALAVVVQLGVYGQETPAGKKAAETFWKAIAEDRPAQAKTSLDSLKRREPNFDASQMEKALAELTEKRESTRSASRSDTRPKIEAGQMLDKIRCENIR